MQASQHRHTFGLGDVIFIPHYSASNMVQIFLETDIRFLKNKFKLKFIIVLIFFLQTQIFEEKLANVERLTLIN